MSEDKFTELSYWKNRCKKAENLCRVVIRVNPMVKDLKPVKEAKEEWTPYCNLHDQLKVWNDHDTERAHRCPNCKKSLSIVDVGDHWTHCNDCGFDFVG